MAPYTSKKALGALCSHRRHVSALSIGLLSLSSIVSYLDTVVPERTMTASATVAQRASIESLFDQADLIMRAQVVKTWSPQSRGTRGQIYTYTYLKALELWRGQLETPEALLVQLGGQIGDLRLEVHGDAKLKEGQELILFLKNSHSTKAPVPIVQQGNEQSTGMEEARQVVHLISLAQGVYHVDRSSENGPAVLYQELDELVFYEAQPAEMKLSYSAIKKVPKEVLTLEGLKTKIHSLIEATKRQGTEVIQGQEAQGEKR